MFPKMGTKVRFRGGTGRRDEEQIIEGIVNGEAVRLPSSREGRVDIYVPVHINATNQNVMVAQSNLIEVA